MGLRVSGVHNPMRPRRPFHAPSVRKGPVRVSTKRLSVTAGPVTASTSPRRSTNHSRATQSTAPTGGAQADDLDGGGAVVLLALAPSVVTMIVMFFHGAPAWEILTAGASVLAGLITVVLLVCAKWFCALGFAVWFAAMTMITLWTGLSFWWTVVVGAAIGGAIIAAVAYARRKLPHQDSAASATEPPTVRAVDTGR